VAKAIMMDEFHITIYAPSGLLPRDYDAIREVLDDPRFEPDLRRSVRSVFRRHLPLVKVRARVTR
jgi:hypothetical protein